MSNIEECSGCGSSNTEINFDVEKIKESMVDTQDKLNDMLNSMNSMNVDFSRFDMIQKQMDKMSELLDSGHLVEKMQQAFGSNTIPGFAGSNKIGRASCRERV